MAQGPVGFIGLGRMGQPMSRNLAAAGFDVIVFDVDPRATEEAAAQNARIHAAESLDAVAKGAGTIILMLPDSPVVRQVLCGHEASTIGEGGLAASLKSHQPGGATIIDMSSSFPPETLALGAMLAERQITLLDAPVSGGVVRAEAATLAIMAGGDDAAIAAHEAVFTSMGQVFRTGALGSGHATKALNNFLSASSTIATAEAILIGQAFGLDPKRMNAVFNNSTGRSNTTDAKVVQYFIPERYESGFTLALLHKDVGMARQMAASMGLEPEVLEKISDLLQRGNTLLGEGADHTAMHAYVKSQFSKQS
ncbi:MAG: NAD(P)-dependent oxidoreductase [Pseudomonadota bacterium]